MVAEISDIIIRESTIEDAAGIAKVHVESWQTSYKGILDQEMLDDISYKERLDLRKKIMAQNRGLSLVAENQDSGEIVGFCDIGKNRGDEPFHFELYAIYLLESVKGLGRGRRLFETARKWCDGQPDQSLIVWVLSDNLPACRFYESMGGKVHSEKQIEIAGLKYKEKSYTWAE